MGTAGCREARWVSGVRGGTGGSEGKTGLQDTNSPFALRLSKCIQASTLSSPLTPINSIRINSIQQAFIECLMSDTFPLLLLEALQLLFPLPFYHSPDSGPVGA